MSSAPKPPCCGWLECQVGLIASFGGAVVIAAAAVFTLFNPIVNQPWYYNLCVFWFLLGLVILVFGIIYELLSCTPGGRWHNKKGGASAREVEEAPTPYVMITA
mmetsp:Transcript_50006/g.116845  ORF Transcript_50006/g.116845 Transcript_50006/m.116845 type:complete len:104 (+) Transcript_50006:116-427(+)